MINIDPDGNDIIYIVNNGNQQRQFKYQKGSFYEQDRRGKYTRRYDPRQESVSPSMYKVLKAYRKIENSNNETLKKVLHKLENSSRKHNVSDWDGKTITSRNSKEIFDPSNPNAPSGSFTMINFSEEEKDRVKEKGSTRDTDFDIIVHEMAHAYDKDIGNTADDESPNSATDPSEIRATFFENLARMMEKKEKATIRIEYGGILIDPEKLKNPPNNKFKR